MTNYISLSKELQEKIKNNTSDKHILSDDAIRRNPDHDKANLWRPAYVRDIEKILHSPYYNRYTDKTQVFSLYKNDDISRRAYHVQLVSRIARNIGPYRSDISWARPRAYSIWSRRRKLIK